jgi:glucose/mannose transport system substrate-binding protein
MSKSKLYGVFTVLMIAMLALSACGGGAQKVEVFSWWTGGGEAAGLDAMIKVFNEKNPNIEFINAAVAGGAGTNARAVLATRLQAGDPPDSWQGHAGQELIGTYVAGNQIQPLNDLYESEGWLAVMPETLIPLISDGGNIYSVPVNIHRANVMWYNPAVLSANGVSVPTTMDEWFAAMDTLQAAGVTPLALGEQWTKMHLMETVLLGTLGPDASTTVCGPARRIGAAPKSRPRWRTSRRL